MAAAFGVVSVAQAYPIDSPLEGVQGPYGAPLVATLKAWPPADLPSLARAPGGELPIGLDCLETPGKPLAIGLVQLMRIHAPLARVAEVLDDFDHYDVLFTGFERIRASARDANRVVTSWEQRVPVPFIPNVKYEMSYLIDRSAPKRIVYRYQLKSGSSLKYSDGIIVIEAEAPDQTRYVEYDFFDADWGPLKWFAPSRIWRESVETLFLSDLAIKLKSEHPEKDYPTIRREAKAALEAYPLDDVLKVRKRFAPPGKASAP